MNEVSTKNQDRTASLYCLLLWALDIFLNPCRGAIHVCPWQRTWLCENLRRIAAAPLRGGGLGPVNTTGADGVASENQSRRGRARRLWWLQGRGRERSMARFSPQPEGTGPVFPIMLSLVAPVTHYGSLLTSRTGKNRLPSQPSQ